MPYGHSVYVVGVFSVAVLSSIPFRFVLYPVPPRLTHLSFRDASTVDSLPSLTSPPSLLLCNVTPPTVVCSLHIKVRAAPVYLHLHTLCFVCAHASRACVVECLTHSPPTVVCSLHIKSRSPFRSHIQSNRRSYTSPSASRESRRALLQWF